MKRLKRSITENSRLYALIAVLSILPAELFAVWALFHGIGIISPWVGAGALLAILPQAVSIAFFIRSIYRPLFRMDSTMDLMLGAKENVLLLTPDDAMEGRPIDAGMLESVQSLIRHVIRLDSTEDLLKKQTELSILQSQINPHFLYNTLDSIRGQAIVDDAEEVADAIEALSKFYRYSISVKGDFVTVEDEMINIVNYIKIQQYRFDNKFIFRIECADQDELDRHIIPKLTIQPLVENSINHAFDDNEEPGNIKLKIAITQSRIIIRVSDDGSGMEEDTTRRMNERFQSRPRSPAAELSKKSSGGLGLQNVNDRIKILFGEDYGITVYSAIGFGTDVEVIIPKLSQEDIEPGKWPR